MNLSMDILEYLMTSDFDEDSDPEKLRSLLKSFRYFYRYQNGVNQSLKNDIDKLKYDFNVRNMKVIKLESDLRIEQQKSKDLINRKLSFRERILGKIIYNNNEHK